MPLQERLLTLIRGDGQATRWEELGALSNHTEGGHMAARNLCGELSMFKK